MYLNTPFAYRVLVLSPDILSKAYQRTVQTGPSGNVLARLQKDIGSSTLDVLEADPDVLRNPFGGLTDFILDAIADIVFAKRLPRMHIPSAERTGAAIFRKELDMARTRMLKAINQIDSKELKRNPFRILQEIDADYAWPMEDNVDFVRQLEDIDKRTGELAMANPELIEVFDSIIGGSYKVVKQQLVFQAKGAGKRRFTMNEASSCIHALLDVGFYLRCRARKEDLFIIDEPELNLHPKNQRAFARLVNAGIKIFITTHSDYLIKELSTLIMLAQKTPHTIAMQQTHGYVDEELLSPQCVLCVCLYMTGTELKAASVKGKRATRINKLKPATIYPDRGIEVKIFDTTIEEMNAIQSKILYGGNL